MADIKTSSALARFLERVAEESVREALPPVYESERHQQAKKDKDLAGLRASDEKGACRCDASRQLLLR